MFAVSCAVEWSLVGKLKGRMGQSHNCHASVAWWRRAAFLEWGGKQGGAPGGGGGVRRTRHACHSRELNCLLYAVGCLY